MVMAVSLNRVTLVGNLGADPEIKNMNDGRAMATMSLATSERWKDKSTGAQQEKTEWHRIKVFNEHLVKIAQDYLRKGNKVMVEGRLETRKYTDKQGVERYTTEVVLNQFQGTLIMFGDGGERSSDSRTPAAKAASAPQPKPDFDDSIPF